MASTGPCRAPGSIARHRGTMAHPARITRPAAPIMASGGPRLDLCGLAASAMCGISRTTPLIATRRCQIAARSMPSNQVSTQGSVLISTSPIESRRTASAPKNCPTYEVAGWPPGRAASHRTAYAATRTTIAAGPARRAGGSSRPRFEIMYGQPSQSSSRQSGCSARIQSKSGWALNQPARGEPTWA